MAAATCSGASSGLFCAHATQYAAPSAVAKRRRSWQPTVRHTVTYSSVANRAACRCTYCSSLESVGSCVNICMSSCSQSCRKRRRLAAKACFSSSSSEAAAWQGIALTGMQSLLDNRSVNVIQVQQQRQQRQQQVAHSTAVVRRQQPLEQHIQALLHSRRQRTVQQQHQHQQPQHQQVQQQQQQVQQQQQQQHVQQPAPALAMAMPQLHMLDLPGLLQVARTVAWHQQEEQQQQQQQLGPLTGSMQEYASNSASSQHVTSGCVQTRIDLTFLHEFVQAALAAAAAATASAGHCNRHASSENAIGQQHIRAPIMQQLLDVISWVSSQLTNMQHQSQVHQQSQQAECVRGLLQQLLQLAVTQQQLQAASCSQLQALLLCYSTLRLVPDQLQLGQWLAAAQRAITSASAAAALVQQQQQQPAAVYHHLVLLLSGLAAVRVSPPSSWLAEWESAALAAMQAMYSSCSNGEASSSSSSNSARSASSRHVLHPSFIATIQQLLHAVASLQLQLSPVFWAAHEGLVQVWMLGCKPQQLLQLLQAHQQCRMKPSQVCIKYMAAQVEECIRHCRQQQQQGQQQNGEQQQKGSSRSSRSSSNGGCSGAAVVQLCMCFVSMAAWGVRLNAISSHTLVLLLAAACEDIPLPLLLQVLNTLGPRLASFASSSSSGSCTDVKHGIGAGLGAVISQDGLENMPGIAAAAAGSGAHASVVMLLEHAASQLTAVLLPPLLAADRRSDGNQHDSNNSSSSTLELRPLYQLLHAATFVRRGAAQCPPRLLQQLQHMSAAAAPVCTAPQLVQLMICWTQLGCTFSWQRGGLRRGYKRLGVPAVLEALSRAELAAAVQAAGKLPPLRNVVQSIAWEVCRRIHLEQQQQPQHCVADSSTSAGPAATLMGCNVIQRQSQAAASAQQQQQQQPCCFTAAQLVTISTAIPALMQYWPSEAALLLLQKVEGLVMQGALNPAELWRIWSALQQLQVIWGPSVAAAAAAAAAPAAAAAVAEPADTLHAQGRGTAAQAAMMTTVSKLTPAAALTLEPAAAVRVPLDAAVAASVGHTAVNSSDSAGATHVASLNNGIQINAAGADSDGSDSQTHILQLLPRPLRRVTGSGGSSGSSYSNNPAASSVENSSTAGSTPQQESYMATAAAAVAVDQQHQGQQQQQHLAMQLGRLQQQVAVVLSRAAPAALPLDALPVKARAAHLNAAQNAAGAVQLPRDWLQEQMQHQAEVSVQQLLQHYAKAYRALLSPDCNAVSLTRTCEGLTRLMALRRFRAAALKTQDARRGLLRVLEANAWPELVSNSLDGHQLLVLLRALQGLNARPDGPYTLQVTNACVDALVKLPAKRLAAVLGKTAAVQVPRFSKAWQLVLLRVWVSKVQRLSADEAVGVLVPLVQLGFRPAAAAAALVLQPLVHAAGAPAAVPGGRDKLLPTANTAAENAGCSAAKQQQQQQQQQEGQHHEPEQREHELQQQALSACGVLLLTRSLAQLNLRPSPSCAKLLLTGHIAQMQHYNVPQLLLLGRCSLQLGLLGMIPRGLWVWHSSGLGVSDEGGCVLWDGVGVWMHEWLSALYSRGYAQMSTSQLVELQLLLADFDLMPLHMMSLSHTLHKLQQQLQVALAAAAAEDRSKPHWQQPLAAAVRAMYHKNREQYQAAAAQAGRRAVKQHRQQQQPRQSTVGTVNPATYITAGYHAAATTAVQQQCLEASSSSGGTSTVGSKSSSKDFGRSAVGRGIRQPVSPTATDASTGFAYPADILMHELQQLQHQRCALLWAAVKFKVVPLTASWVASCLSVFQSRFGDLSPTVAVGLLSAAADIAARKQSTSITAVAVAHGNGSISSRKAGATGDKVVNLPRRALHALSHGLAHRVLELYPGMPPLLVVQAAAALAAIGAKPAAAAAVHTPAKLQWQHPQQQAVFLLNRRHQQLLLLGMLRQLSHLPPVRLPMLMASLNQLLAVKRRIRSMFKHQRINSRFAGRHSRRTPAGSSSSSSTAGGLVLSSGWMRQLVHALAASAQATAAVGVPRQQLLVLAAAQHVLPLGKVSSCSNSADTPVLLVTSDAAPKDCGDVEFGAGPECSAAYAAPAGGLLKPPAPAPSAAAARPQVLIKVAMRAAGAQLLAGLLQAHKQLQHIQQQQQLQPAPLASSHSGTPTSSSANGKQGFNQQQHGGAVLSGGNGVNDRAAAAFMSAESPVGVFLNWCAATQLQCDKYPVKQHQQQLQLVAILLLMLQLVPADAAATTARTFGVAPVGLEDGIARAARPNAQQFVLPQQHQHQQRSLLQTLLRLELGQVVSDAVAAAAASVLQQQWMAANDVTVHAVTTSSNGGVALPTLASSARLVTAAVQGDRGQETGSSSSNLVKVMPQQLAAKSLQVRFDGLLRWAFLAAAQRHQQQDKGMFVQQQPDTTQSGRRQAPFVHSWGQQQPQHLQPAPANTSSTSGTGPPRCSHTNICCNDDCCDDDSQIVVLPVMSRALDLQFARLLRKVVQCSNTQVAATHSCTR